jgi:hypothetical protein
MFATLLMISCGGPSETAMAEDCQSEVPPMGEVWAKRISCLAEIPVDGEGTFNDWLLVNAFTRLVIRDATHRLTRLDGTGGTVIDASSTLGDDGLTELIPLMQGGWPISGEIYADDGQVILEGKQESGDEVTIQYTLDPWATQLQVGGALGFDLVPNAGSILHGHLVQDELQNIPFSTGSLNPIIDHGGWLTFTESDSIAMGSIDDVAATLWPDHVQANGVSDGEHIEVTVFEETLFRVPVADGSFSLTVPQDAKLQAQKRGHQTGEPQTPSDELNLSVGLGGFITMQVMDESGGPIPATMNWNGQSHPIGITPTTLPVGPETGSGLVDAGPEYAQFLIEEQAISGVQELTIMLESVAMPAALLALDIPSFPDRTERRTINEVLFEQAAKGIDYVVLTAGDEVAQASGIEDMPAPIHVQAGSRAMSDTGTPFAWPWSLRTRAPAHGAAPWSELDATDLLAVMSKGGRRYSAVDSQWVAAAGAATNWGPEPDVFMLRTIDDLATYTDLLDQWIPVSAAGPLTWAEVNTRNRTDMVRALLAGKTTASTGPRILLSVDGYGPGSDLSSLMNDPIQHHEVVITTQGQGALSHAALLGPTGSILSSWTPKSEPHVVSVSGQAWVLAAVWDNSDWAVTSPVWLQRP